MTVKIDKGDLVMLKDDVPDHWWTVMWVGVNNFTCSLCPGDPDDVQASPNFDEILMVARSSDPDFEKWSHGMLEDASWHRTGLKKPPLKKPCEHRPAWSEIRERYEGSECSMTVMCCDCSAIGKFKITAEEVEWHGHRKR